MILCSEKSDNFIDLSVYREMYRFRKQLDLHTPLPAQQVKFSVQRQYGVFLKLHTLVESMILQLFSQEQGEGQVLQKGFWLLHHVSYPSCTGILSYHTGQPGQVSDLSIYRQFTTTTKNFLFLVFYLIGQHCEFSMISHGFCKSRCHFILYFSILIVTLHMHKQLVLRHYS